MDPSQGLHQLRSEVTGWPAELLGVHEGNIRRPVTVLAPRGALEVHGIGRDPDPLLGKGARYGFSICWRVDIVRLRIRGALVGGGGSPGLLDRRGDGHEASSEAPAPDTFPHEVPPSVITKLPGWWYGEDTVVSLLPSTSPELMRANGPAAVSPCCHVYTGVVLSRIRAPVTFVMVIDARCGHRAGPVAVL